MFRSSSFSQRSFSAKSWRFDGQIEKPVDNGWLGGGSGIFDHFQSAEEKRKERERLGIIPPAVERAIEVVARIEARGQMAYEKVSDRAHDELKAYLDTENEAWYNFYDELLRDAIRGFIREELERIAILEQEAEEQEIMMLLFDM